MYSFYPNDTLLQHKTQYLFVMITNKASRISYTQPLLCLKPYSEGINSYDS